MKKQRDDSPLGKDRCKATVIRVKENKMCQILVYSSIRVDPPSSVLWQIYGNQTISHHIIRPYRQWVLILDEEGIGQPSMVIVVDDGGEVHGQECEGVL